MSGEQRRAPALHRLRGSATACGIPISARMLDHFQHPRLPSTARSYRSATKVIYATAVADDVTCGACKDAPK